MNKVAESLVIIAERDLGAAATLMPLSTRHAAVWIYEAAAKLLEALVRVDTDCADAPRGQVERLMKRLPVSSPFATDVWAQIEPTWAAEAYDLLIADDGTIAPDPLGSSVQQALRDLRTVLPSIREHVRKAAESELGEPDVDGHAAAESDEQRRTPASADTVRVSVADEQGLISPEALAEVLDLRITELARLFHLSPDSVRHSSASAETQRRLADVLDVLTEASELMPDGIGASVRWLKFEPLPGLGNKTAAELIAAGHASAVMTYLQLVENGVYG